MKNYRVVVYREGLLGSIFLGSSKVNPERCGNFLNEHAAEGYRVVTMERESRRALLIFKREAFVFVLEKDA